MRVGLLLKRNKPEAVDIALELCDWLASRGVEVWSVSERPELERCSHAVGEAELAARIDLLVVLGGDGTLLHGAELVAGRGVPILGVNLGNLGFLTSSPPAQGRHMLELALDGKLALERRLRLSVRVYRGGVTPPETLLRYACNDAVISQGALARLVEIEALLDEKPITTYRADGLIVATPTGSTAYTLAAGGPILSPDVHAMVVTPICPHALTNRPLVVPASSRLRVRLGGDARNVVLTIDGQWGTEFGPEDEVEIHAADEPLLLYRPADITYFEILRSKLRWGERAA